MMESVAVESVGMRSASTDPAASVVARPYPFRFDGTRPVEEHVSVLDQVSGAAT